MGSAEPTPRTDTRFSDPASGPTGWADTVAVLEEAGLYWLTSVRGDGRPHVTPVVGLRHDDAAHFCTGPDEQKFRNLERNPPAACGTSTSATGASRRAGMAVVFRVSMDKVLAFAKSPHAQTTFRLRGPH